MKDKALSVSFDKHAAFQLLDEWAAVYVSGGDLVRANATCTYARHNAVCADANVTCSHTAAAPTSNDVCAAPNVLCRTTYETDAICVAPNGSCN